MKEENMKIPKVISKNNHEYIFVKQVNKNVFLYKDLMYGYNECFSPHDLGLVKEKVKPSKSYIRPENVKCI